MKKTLYLAGSASMLALPMLASANFTSAGGEFGQLLIDLVTFANTILIPFIIAIGFLVFVWGMFQYFIAGGSNDEAKEKGKSLMIYATLGFVLIVVFWGIINLLATSTGLYGETLDATPIATVPST